MVGDAVVGGGGSLASAVWPAANRAIFIPFSLVESHTYVRACLANGATLSGNFDIGVYDLDGNRLFSTGTQAQAGTANVIRAITINWLINPGVYYLALAIDNVTATVISTGTGATNLRGVGAKQMTSGFVLPATATFAALASSYFPLFGISEKSWL